MKKILGLSIAILFITVVLSDTASADFKKTKIAVLDFQLQGENFETADMGKIVAEWLITALVKEGRFDVIERRLLEKVIEEQKLGASGLVDESTAAKLGKTLGAKIVITGSVMKFQNVMEVNARIIEVESSSIIAAESVKSASAVKLEDLVVQMAEKIIKDFPLEGYIVQREEKKVMIDLGKRAGVKTGMQFMVYKEGKVIKHPKTGEVLDIEKIETGTIEIKDVKDKTSDGIILKETAPNAIIKGQLVKSTVELVPPEPALPEIGAEPEKPEKPSREVREMPADESVLSRLRAIDSLSEEMRLMRERGNRIWKNMFKKILSDLGPILKRYRTSPEVYLSCARAYYSADRLSDAEKFLKRALHLRPQYTEALIFRGDMYYDYAKKNMDRRHRKGFSMNARDSYQKALNAAQDRELQAMLYFKIGNVYAIEGDKENARENWKKAVSAAPGSKAARLASERLKR